MNAVTAWSFSRWETFELCPLKFKLKFIDKIDDKPGPGMERGRQVHKLAEEYIRGDIAELPKELKKFDKLMGELRGLPEVMVEQQWGFTQQWKPTAWFDRGKGTTWLRVVLDAGVLYEDGTADVVDHKTGKKYEISIDQMELFGLATMCRFPSVHTVTTRLWYLDTGDEEVAQFESKNLDQIKEKWTKRANRMLGTSVFPARPNEKCRWCAYAKSSGGQCRFG